jgi:hypothetical protein
MQFEILRLVSVSISYPILCGCPEQRLTMNRIMAIIYRIMAISQALIRVFDRETPLPVRDGTQVVHAGRALLLAGGVVSLHDWFRR